MIEHFEAHSANERTYLAWVRTALSIAAFGFIVDKFSLWANATIEPNTTHLGFIFDHAGLTMLTVSLIVLAGSTIRFLATSRRIDSEKTFPWRYDTSDLLLGISLIAIALVTVILMLHVLSD